jgi:CheY-like chemotaxis protein
MIKRILVVDDNDDIRENTAELLGLEGFQVTMAESGELAIEHLKAHVPDLVICDIVMSGMDGYEVFSALKNNHQTTKIPFVFSTAKAEKSDRQKAEDMGANGYLVKPFDHHELLNCIKNCCQPA